MKSMLLFLLFIVIQKASAGFEPPVIIDPPNPQEGDMVRVGLFERYYPPCLGIPQKNSIGENYSLSRNGNQFAVEVLAATAPLCNPIPFSPAPRVYYNLGVLESGEYMVDTSYIEVSGFTMDMIPPFPMPPFFTPRAFGSTISFIVGSKPRVVNFFTLLSLLTTLILIFSITHLFYRKYHVS